MLRERMPDETSSRISRATITGGGSTPPSDTGPRNRPNDKWPKPVSTKSGNHQDAVLHGLVPALDLALGLRVVRGAADMGHALALKPGGEVGGDIRRAVVAEQARPVKNTCAVAARGFQGELQRVGDVAGAH